MPPLTKLLRRNVTAALSDEPLSPGDERDFDLYDAAGGIPGDPVRLLKRSIETRDKTSVHLLSGYRGTGKSTQLRRLDAELTRSGYFVVYVDLEAYIGTSEPVELVDFLLAVGMAFGDALTARLAGSFAFFADAVRKIRSAFDAETEVVLLVDSREKINGSFGEGDKVQLSVVNLFQPHAPQLQIPSLHVVYTIPPYVRVRAGDVGALYGASALQIFPAINVGRRDERDGAVVERSRAAVMSLVRKRLAALPTLFTETQLEGAIETSGGCLRDPMRLLREALLHADDDPLTDEAIAAAVNQLRVGHLPIPDDDARRLARIGASKTASIASQDEIAAFARFLDNGQVLCYADSPEWYDVHPLIAGKVREQVEALDAEEVRHREKAQPSSDRG